MGLAVLPARLKEELNILREYLINKTQDISNDEIVSKHSEWYNYLLKKHSSITSENVDNIMKEEVGLKFSEVLYHAGVFKRNESGFAAFDKFINIL